MHYNEGERVYVIRWDKYYGLKRRKFEAYFGTLTKDYDSLYLTTSR